MVLCLYIIVFNFFIAIGPFKNKALVCNASPKFRNRRRVKLDTFLKIQCGCRRIQIIIQGVRGTFRIQTGGSTGGYARKFKNFFSIIFETLALPVIMLHRICRYKSFCANYGSKLVIRLIKAHLIEFVIGTGHFRFLKRNHQVKAQLGI